MLHIAPVSSSLFISGYIDVNAIPSLAQKGIRSIISLVPEDDSRQPNNYKELSAAAKDAGLECIHLPVVAGSCNADQAMALSRIRDQLPQPTLAFCRNGARPITLWALEQVMQEQDTAESVIAHAAELGYDVQSAVQSLPEPLPDAPPPVTVPSDESDSTTDSSADDSTEQDSLPLAITLCPQLMVGDMITPEDIPQLASLGIRSIICQLPKTAEYTAHFKAIDTASRACDIMALHQPADIDGDRIELALGFHRLLRGVPQPAFAYHLAADLSATLWAMAQVEKHKRPVDEVLSRIRSQGLRVLPALERFITERANISSDHTDY